MDQFSFLNLDLAAMTLFSLQKLDLRLILSLAVARQSTDMKTTLALLNSSVVRDTGSSTAFCNLPSHTLKKILFLSSLGAKKMSKPQRYFTTRVDNVE